MSGTDPWCWNWCVFGNTCLKTRTTSKLAFGKIKLSTIYNRSTSSPVNFIKFMAHGPRLVKTLV